MILHLFQYNSDFLYDTSCRFYQHFTIQGYRYSNIWYFLKAQQKRAGFYDSVLACSIFFNLKYD